MQRVRDLGPAAVLVLAAAVGCGAKTGLEALDGESSTGSSGTGGGGGSAPEPPACAASEGTVVLASGLTWPIAMAIDESAVFATELDMEGAIVRVPKAGGAASKVADITWPDGIALDDDSVYIASNDGVGRVSKDGGTVELLGSTNSPTGVAVDGADVYFADYLGFAIGRVAKTGGPATLLAQGLDGSPYRLAVGPTHVYWSGIGAGLKAVDKSGGPVAVVASGSPRTQVVVDGDVYYTETGTTALMRVGPQGSAQTIADLAPFGLGAEGVAVDETHAYVTLYSGTVLRVPRDGGQVEVLETDQRGPGHIAVDESCIYWTEIADGDPGAGTIKRRAK